MNESLKRLRDAVVRQDRDVEVTPDGTVREVATRSSDERETDEPRKPTKLAKRVFGGRRA
jgi:hypothetical protein